MASVDVIVIGGGIHGCSAAFHLARRGASVLLLEKDTLGRHASGVNAGGVRQIFRAMPEVPLSVAAMALWERIADLLGDDRLDLEQGRPIERLGLRALGGRQRAGGIAEATMRDLAHSSPVDESLPGPAHDLARRNAGAEREQAAHDDTRGEAGSVS